MTVKIHPAVDNGVKAGHAGVCRRHVDVQMHHRSR